MLNTVIYIYIYCVEWSIGWEKFEREGEKETQNVTCIFLSTSVPLNYLSWLQMQSYVGDKQQINLIYGCFAIHYCKQNNAI